ncbi:ParB/RepB/Spo0J family partition protein [Streptomyces javensis]|uniref:ParB/RepB/Spo0J family partition protein n=1 Tax=Streptomyces javensis TaxID=114698 RepID=A0ABS0RBL0_9ACTN|nr:ParB/RepB/Spo0J family partition protein [Streptomyces javensis]MBI0314107.1 ParB/RepB/Spo0J family partition protein [Streptomyces javensis]
MSSKASKLGASTSFGQARPVSARRAAISAATGARTEGVPDPTELPVGQISQNPDNPRDHLRDLEDITQSIKELGVINAITVASIDAYLRERPDRADDLDEGTKYVVVDGHRRLEGSRRAGKDTIKVMVDDARVATDEALLEAAFVANFHRDDMTDLEQAHVLESLVKFYGSQTKASQRLGLPQATISSKLSLLKLSPDLQAELVSGERQVEHVRNLGKLSPEEQRAAADTRAAEAKRRAEQKRAGQKAVTQTDDYHAVISQGADKTITRLSAGGTTTQSEAESKTAAGATSTAVPAQPAGREQDSADGNHEPDPMQTVPWRDVHAVAELIRDRMTYEEQKELADLLRSHVAENA